MPQTGESGHPVVSHTESTREARPAAVPPVAWARQPGEGPRAYAAFCGYRDMGPRERTLKKAAALAYGTQQGLHGVPSVKPGQLRNVEEWSRRYSWVDRAQAWDDLLDTKGLMARIKAVQAMNRRHAIAARAMFGSALRRLEQTAQSSHLMSWDGVRRWLKDTILLERLIRGAVPGAGHPQRQHSERPPAEDTTVQQFDLGVLSDEEQATLARLLLKMTGQVDAMSGPESTALGMPVHGDNGKAPRAEIDVAASGHEDIPGGAEEN